LKPKDLMLDRCIDSTRMKMQDTHAERIQSTIDKNRILELQPYSMDAVTNFRSRSVNKEIQRSMRYKTTNDFCIFLEQIDHEDRIRNKWTLKDIEEKIVRNSNIKPPLNPLDQLKNKFNNSF